MSDTLHQPTEPPFEIGDVVSVLDDPKRRSGPIYHLVWHYKHGVWFYFIRSEERKEPKRFSETELRKAD